MKIKHKIYFATILFSCAFYANSVVNANVDATSCSGSQGYVDGIACSTGGSVWEFCDPSRCQNGVNDGCVLANGGCGHWVGCPTCPDTPPCVPSWGEWGACNCPAGTKTKTDGCGGSQTQPCACAGACGTASKVYAATASGFGADTWCSAGTASFPNGAISFPNQGSKTSYWSCVGVNGGQTLNNCQAGRQLPPPTSVDLKINGSNGPLTVNKDTDVLNLAWTSNGNKCEGSGFTWITPTANALNLPGSGSDTRSPRATGFPHGADTYTAQCWNDNGDPSLASTKVSDSVNVTTVCNANLNPAWGVCSAVCGGGTQTRTVTNTNCTSVVQTNPSSCNNFACPNWQEVNP